jgi:hypothetical protein
MRQVAPGAEPKVATRARVSAARRADAGSSALRTATELSGSARKSRLFASK